MAGPYGQIQVGNNQYQDPQGNIYDGSGNFVGTSSTGVTAGNNSSSGGSGGMNMNDLMSLLNQNSQQNASFNWAGLLGFYDPNAPNGIAPGQLMYQGQKDTGFVGPNKTPTTTASEDLGYYMMPDGSKQPTLAGTLQDSNLTGLYKGNPTPGLSGYITMPDGTKVATTTEQQTGIQGVQAILGANNDPSQAFSYLSKARGIAGLNNISDSMRQALTSTTGMSMDQLRAQPNPTNAQLMGNIFQGLLNGGAQPSGSGSFNPGGGTGGSIPQGSTTDPYQPQPLYPGGNPNGPPQGSSSWQPQPSYPGGSSNLTSGTGPLGLQWTQGPDGQWSGTVPSQPGGLQSHLIANGGNGASPDPTGGQGTETAWMGLPNLSNPLLKAGVMDPAQHQAILDRINQQNPGGVATGANISGLPKKPDGSIDWSRALALSSGATNTSANPDLSHFMSLLHQSKPGNSDTSMATQGDTGQFSTLMSYLHNSKPTAIPQYDTTGRLTGWTPNPTSGAGGAGGAAVTAHPMSAAMPNLTQTGMSVPTGWQTSGQGLSKMAPSLAGAYQDYLQNNGGETVNDFTAGVKAAMPEFQRSATGRIAQMGQP